jgi:hypothetical protein
MSLDDYREHLDFKTRMDRLAERTANLRVQHDGDTDEERRAADYGLTTVWRKDFTTDNVIKVDFANRARVSGTQDRRSGR